MRLHAIRMWSDEYPAVLRDTTVGYLEDPDILL